MTVPYCAKTDVKNQLTAGNFSADWDAVIDGVILAVSAEFDREVAMRRGIRAPWSFIADALASARRFTGWEPGRRYLPIDDCVAVTSVTNAGTALVADVDYVVDPLNGTPIGGLVRLNGMWSAKPGDISAACRWGYADTNAPADVKQGCIRESIRAYLAARAGNDDRLGLTPFGQVVTSKAFTSDTMLMLAAYGRRTGGAR